MSQKELLKDEILFYVKKDSSTNEKSAAVEAGGPRDTGIIGKQLIIENDDTVEFIETDKFDFEDIENRRKRRFDFKSKDLMPVMKSDFQVQIKKISNILNDIDSELEVERRKPDRGESDGGGPPNDSIGFFLEEIELNLSVEAGFKLAFAVKGQGSIRLLYKRK